MKTRDVVRRAGRSLLQAKMRTLLTSLAIAVGAFTLTLSLAAGEGSRQYADKLIGSNVNPRAMFIVKDKALFDRGGAQGGGLKEYDPDVTSLNGTIVKQLTQKDIDTLRARNDLEQVQPLYQISAKYFMVEGSEKKYTSDLVTYDPTVIGEASSGSLPKLGDELADGDVVLPQEYAATLTKNEASLIGKKVTLTIAKPASAPTQEDIDQVLSTQGVAGLSSLAQTETKEVTLTIRAIAKKSSLAIATTTGLQISGGQSREIAEYETKGTDAYQKYAATTALVREGYTPTDVKKSLEEAGYPSQTAKDLQNLIFTIVNILQGVVIGFAMIALIASVFGIVNTQYISVLERTGQIGLMKALGMRGRDVARLFRYEAAWIGFLGGVIGATGAWALGTALNPWITKQLNLGDGNHILIFQWLPIAALVVALMVIAVFAGYLPARKAAKLDPIEALRTE